MDQIMNEQSLDLLSQIEEEKEIIQRLILRKKAEESFYEFVKQAWPIIEGTNPFVDNWHIEAVCEHLEACNRREIRDFICNQPPRTTKSTLFSVSWPAWTWIRWPEEKFLYCSHDFKLATRLSEKCRDLIASNWYQTNWGHLYTIPRGKDAKLYYANDKGGYRLTLSVNSGSTGLGGTIKVLDDPNDLKKVVFSAAHRDGVNNYITGAWSSRIIDPLTSVDVIVQQRGHHQDATGHVIEIYNQNKNKYVHLVIPMEFEKSRKCSTIVLPSTGGKVWSDPREKEGELLWPERFTHEFLKKERGKIKEYGYAGQYQQRPSPAGGGIIKGDYFQTWKHLSPPKMTQVIQSWDTALETKDTNAYSACTTWGLFKEEKGRYSIILLSMWRGRVEYPELRKMAKRLYRDYRDDGEIEIIPDTRHMPDYVLVEAEVSGISLLQDLNQAGIPVTRFVPKGDKLERVRLVTHLIENGRVWLPALPPSFSQLRKFARTFLDNCEAFPNEESRDLVDTMTQVLIRLNNDGWLTNTADAEIKGGLQPRFSAPD
ncbi:MAG TPA: phage terminase large subunit [Candidatus Babeliaceae bacterium]|nr:phage terminase large subunit [Candidatus Babeliaceae bacterium]